MAGDPPNNPPEEGRGSGTASRPPPSETTSNTHSSLPLSSLPGSVPNDGAPAQSEQARSSSEGPLESPTGREKLPNSPVLRRNLPRSSQRKRKPVDQPAEEAQEFPTEVPTEVQKEAQTEETNSSREEEQAGQEVALTCKDGEDGGSTSSEEGGRKRRKLNDTGESATGSTKSSAAPKKKSRMSATGTPRSDKRWEAPFVYTDERSPLVNGNLRVRACLPYPAYSYTPLSLSLSISPDQMMWMLTGSPKNTGYITSPRSMGCSHSRREGRDPGLVPRRNTYPRRGDGRCTARHRGSSK